MYIGLKSYYLQTFSNERIYIFNIYYKKRKLNIFVVVTQGMVVTPTNSEENTIQFFKLINVKYRKE